MLHVWVSALPQNEVSSGKHLSKRALPDLIFFPSDETSQDHKAKLSAAMSDTLLLVQQVSLSYPGDDGSGPYKDIWSKYFPDTNHKAVQGVWNQIMSDPKNPGQGEDRIKQAIILGEDFAKVSHIFKPIQLPSDFIISCFKFHHLTTDGGWVLYSI